MSPRLQKLRHSFVNTLFYIWTLLHTLLTRKATPSSSPDHLTLVPYPNNVDLERGSIECVKAVRKALMEDARRQEGLRGSPLFSEATHPKSDLGASVGTDDAYESASTKSGNTLPAPLQADDTVSWEHDSADISSAYSHNTSETTDRPPDLDASTAPVAAPAPGNVSQCSDVFTDNSGKSTEIGFGGYPFASSPPKTPRYGRGHRRAALTTITNFAHVAALFNPVDTSSPLTDRPAGATKVQRMRSQSLRRKPAFDDLHSPSPKRKYPELSLEEASPTKRPASIVWFSDKNGIPMKSVSPLRIIKRNGRTPSAQLRSFPGQIEEEYVQDVVTAVRHLREDDYEDEGAAARELINRASIWTCKTAATLEDTLDHEEETDDDEYGDQATCRSTCSPPPPYAFANAGFFPALKQRLPEFSTSCDAKAKSPRALSASSSTELSYLQDESPLSSVDSSLEDILTSFEDLITTMSPRYEPPDSKALKAAPATTNTASCGSRGDMQCYPYDGIATDEAGGCGAPHWSEVLLLEGYTV